jgi:hypothetical protein
MIQCNPNSITVTKETSGKVPVAWSATHKLHVGTVRRLFTWVFVKWTVVGAFVTQVIPIVGTRLTDPFQYYIHLSRHRVSVYSPLIIFSSHQFVCNSLPRMLNSSPLLPCHAYWNCLLKYLQIYKNTTSNVFCFCGATPNRRSGLGGLVEISRSHAIRPANTNTR